MSEHEGMMTRREVLEDLFDAPYRLRRSKLVEPYVAGVMVALVGVLNLANLLDAAHELALMIDAERSGAHDG